MTTLFSSQLARIAADSSHEFDLRARKTSHGESLLFPRDVASKQGWDTIYAICVEGFKELCLLDPSFTQYERNLFSPQSKDQDREQMNKADNEKLDSTTKRCLGLLGGKLLLNPGLRCVEWLVRRFRIHVHNTTELLLMALPYHELPIWRNILNIIPQQKLVGQWKFLLPYQKDAGNIPKHTIVYAATNNDAFFTALSDYVRFVCAEGASHTSLMRFWAGVVTEAAIGRLGAAKSGRKEVQKQRMEDALLKILPVLSDGFQVKGCPELTTTCLTLAMVLAAKADLDDRVLDSLLDAVAFAARSAEVDLQSTIVAMIVILAQKSNRVIPKNGLKVLAGIPNFEMTLKAMSSSYPTSILVESLINGIMDSVKQKNLSIRLSFIDRLLRHAIQQNDEPTFMVAVKAIISRMSTLQISDDTQDAIRTSLADMLRGLNEDSKYSRLIAEATSGSNEQKEQLEALMGTTIARIEAPLRIGSDEMEIDTAPTTEPSIDQSISNLPSKTAHTTSFLGRYEQQLFEQLTECFALCCRSDMAVLRFAALEIWSSSISQSSLFYTFLLRISLGPYSTRQRSSALFLLGNSVKDSDLDCQGLVPYLLIALSDSVSSVRRAAGDVLTTIATTSNKASQLSKQVIFGAEGLYDRDSMEQVTWIPTNHLLDIITQAIMPALEECALDATHVGKVVSMALNGSEQTQTGMKTDRVELKKSLRHSLFDLLTSHAVATPLLRMKVETAQLLRGVSKVGTATKSKALSSVLRYWAALDHTRAQAMARAEKLEPIYVNGVMMQLITAQDKDAVGRVLTMIEDGKVAARPDLAAAFFNRVQSLWNDLKHEAQVSCALKLFDFSFTGEEAIQSGAQSTLQNANLSTDILGGILERSMSDMTQTEADEQQPRKKRRVSHGHSGAPPQMAQAMELASSRLTLALELVDNSKPETRPELVPVLFDLLAMLKRLKQQQSLDSPYLINLCLSSILAIVDRQKSLSRTSIDMASIRADLVTDCIRSSDNPQVQNTALLLSASLATLAPDRMLHNVMPVFTFVGQSVLSKEDDYSINVINQAIDQIVPAIIQSLRRQRKDMIKSTSGMLASFAAAFDHIPPQRKVALYQRLLNRMGAAEYAFLLLAMLTLRQGDKQTVRSFIDALLGELSAYAQLATYHRLLDLASDTIKKESVYAGDVLEIDKKATIEEKRRISNVVFSLGLQILRSKSLKSQVSTMHRLAPESAETLRLQLASCFPQLLICIQAISRDGQDTEKAKECVDALLDLPSLAELFNMMPRISSLLEHEPDLHAQALRVLVSKVDGRAPKDSRTRNAGVELIGKLTEYINRPLEQLQVKQAMIICIDKISEAYGRKDIQKVLEAASVIAGQWCLVADEPVSDRRTQMMSLLCLASLLEVLKESCAPVVPELFEVVLEILGTTVSDKEDEEMHNTCYTLIAGIVAHVPYLVSDDNLAKLLVISSEAANKYTSISAKDARVEVLSTIGSKIDMVSLVTAMLGNDMEVSRQYPRTAEPEKLDLMSIGIDSATKAMVVRYADEISKYLLTHLDQRRNLADSTDEDIESILTNIETKINQVSVKFIYKLNDTAFRPIFESWMDWGINAHDLSATSDQDTSNLKILRQTSLFNLLTNFFSTLKAIVTSYASYIITPASTILTSTTTQSQSQTNHFTMTPPQQTLYISLLHLLRTTLLHDADNLFTSPSNFTPLAAPLISQLHLSSSKSLRPLVFSSIIPTILSLATATVDTPSHHQSLCHHLVQLRHSPSASVRLSSIRTLAALSADEEIGDDWIANTIGVGAGSAGAGYGGAGAGAESTAGDGVGIARGGGSSAGQVMIYVNEMLEDDDEEVEMEVRRWVQSVRERVGEDVFEV